MLDKQNNRILNKLHKLCPDGSYKVFEIQELCSLFNLKKDTINNDFQYLKDNEYIDIKYSDNNVICLCLLPKSRQLKEFENVKNYSYTNIMKMLLISGIFSGLMAFLGAFIAMLIIKWGRDVIKKRENFDELYIW